MIRLNDGSVMPRLGYGVYKVAAAESASLVGKAIEAGYRGIDTASFYDNEAGVGEAVRAATVARGALFVTTKIGNDDHGFDAARRAFDRSHARLGLDTVDLLLIHWPQPARNRYVETWRALIDLRREGRVRAIGVSNFAETHLERLIAETGVVPAVNQVELHPRYQQRDLRAFHARHGIATECWSPLGRARFLGDPALATLAAKHDRTPAQIVLRWHLDSGSIAIPKSATPARIVENADVFGFALDADDHAVITAMDDPAGRMGADPAAFG